MLQAGIHVYVLSHDDADILSSPIGSVKHVGDILKKTSQLCPMRDEQCLLWTHNTHLLLLHHHSFSLSPSQ